MFILSTLIVDAHKYYMCYWAAEDASQIGKKIKSETKDASNVLLIQYGDWELKKDGAFVRNLIYDFFEGGAAETAAPPGCAPTEFRCLGLSIFSVSESVVKKHVIFYVFLLFYLFIPLLLLANIIQENFREKTHSIETERGTKKLRAHPQRGCTCLKCTACCVGLWLAVLVYG